MTPSEIAGRLMILGAQMENEQRMSAAEACAEAAAWILFYLDKTEGKGGGAYESRTITSTPLATVTPMFNSILKRDLDV